MADQDPKIQDLIDLAKTSFQPHKAAGITATIQLNLTGNQSGQWKVSIHDQKLDVEEGVAETPRLTVTADSQDVLDMFAGKLDPMKAFMLGRMKVKGDQGFALKATTFFTP